MQAVIDQVHKKLLKSGKTVSVAESCTGGMISEFLTRKPGSSAYFYLGAVVYSNRSKARVTKVPAALITRKGAVSKEVAVRLAKGVRKLAGTDIGLGVTGIAGPSGALPGKPVGLVFIAAESRVKKVCRKFILRGNRSSIRLQATNLALGIIKNLI